MHVLKYYYIENVTVCVNYTNFYTRAKRGEAKPSNNISERRMSKANEPVSEHSERASGYALGCMSRRAERGTRGSGVYYIIIDTLISL